MKRQIRYLLAIFCSGLLHQGAHADETIRVAYPVQIHTANMMLLADQAKKNGVTVDAAVMRGYPAIELALTTNQIDVAMLGFVNIGLMHEKGVTNQKVIAGVFSGGQSLTLRNGVTVTTWKDLEGKRIGSAPNTYADLLFKASAKLGGADLTKINFVSFAPPGGAPVLAAMRDRDIDGFVFWEPLNAEAKLGNLGYYSSLDIGANPTRHINGALLVNASYAAAHRAAVAALVKSLVQTTDALNADAGQWTQVAERVTGTKPEIVKEAAPRGRMDYKLYRKEAKALMRMIFEAGITKVDASPAVDTMFDYSFLEQATGKSARELGGE